MSRNFIDAHMHLQDSRFLSADAQKQVMTRASLSKVTALACNATNEDDWQEVLTLAAKHSVIKPFLGVHPWFAHLVKPGWLNRLDKLLDTSGAGVGEIGIDSFGEAADIVQEKVFVKQLKLACNKKIPTTIHCIRRWGKLLEILKSHAPFKQKIMVHSFSGSIETMQRLVEFGVLISFSCQLACPTRMKLRKVFLKTPIQNILLETDAPDQFCRQLFSASKNANSLSEPAHVARLYKFAANLRNIDLNDFTKDIWNNGKIFTNRTADRS
ncbi:MAG: TatD family hydrolase [Magnetococcales bacterium]|nr:TatD family hydrolase [Magnetococcales bacterium]